jgi:transcriptional/translational regulatory protein YebC/TACO1
MFDHVAIFVFAHADEDAVLEALMDADVDVSEIEDDNGTLTVFTPNTEYFKAKQALTEAFGELDFDVDEIQFVPQSYTTISSEDMEMFDKFMAMLNDLDDVQNVYHNVDLG